MTYVDATSHSFSPALVPGRASDTINRFFGGLKKAGQAGYIDFGGNNATSWRTPLEQRLNEVQRAISSMSMHLPQGFSAGLNQQFANLMDEDAWEDDDEFPIVDALSTFLNVLISTRTNRRPGIGTNGRGSISAFWTNGGNRLTVECLPSGSISWVLTRADASGQVERAAGVCGLGRLNDVLRPYRPEVWFDQ